MGKKKTIEEMSTEKVLEKIYDLLQRAKITNQFIKNDDGIITHEMTIVSCDDKFFASQPKQLEHPLVLAVPVGTIH